METNDIDPMQARGRKVLSGRYQPHHKPHWRLKRSLTDKQRRGCMLVNSAIESAPYDAQFFDIVAAFLDEVERFFLRCVSNGQRDGTITKAHSAEDLSKSLLGILLGIRVLARVRPERKLLEGLLRPAFALLDNAPSAKRRKTA